MTRRNTLAVALLTLAVGAGCTDSSLPVQPEPTDPSASPAAVPGSPGPSRFIVTLTDGVDARNVAAEHGVVPDFVYGHVLNGFAGSISEAAKAGLLRDSRIQRIEADEMVTIANTQISPPWGLDRVDQRNGLDASYSYAFTGTGVTAYIVDTGIRYTHDDFEGRASFGVDVFGGDGADCHGHGTHVAGTVGGERFGVAKDVALVSVRVLSCSGAGSSSGVIAALDWIASTASGPSVVNMSLGGGATKSMDDAVERLAQAGVVVAVAAGNSGADACNYSPARAPSALTVGATDKADNKASWSNWGSCVDIFAPGAGILSASYTGDGSTTTKSGTSMASPHVAGAAALILQEFPSASVQQVADVMLARATQNVVAASNSPAPHLLYAVSDGSPPPETETNQPPAADFSSSCDALACQFTDGSSDPDGSVMAWSWDFGDGASSSAATPAHSYGAAGSYTVVLTVTDDDGATTSAAHGVTVQQSGEGGTNPGEPPTEPEPQPNKAPTADFSPDCTGLECRFDDASSDPDGSVVDWSWRFGDGASDSKQNPVHTFAAPGTYTVDLEVTDDAGAKGSMTRSVTVEVPGIYLQVTQDKFRGHHVLNLYWSGADSGLLDVLVDGGVISSVPGSDGFFSWTTFNKGKGSYLVQVCEASGGRCSNEVFVNY